MNLDAAVHSHEPEHLVAIDGVAAGSQRIVDALQVPVDNQHIIVAPDHLSRRVDVFKFLSRAGRAEGLFVALVLLNLQIFFNDGIRVKCSVGNLFVEVACLLEAQLLHRLVHQPLLQLYLAVLHAALQHFLGENAVLDLSLAQGLTNLCLGAAGLHNVHPVLLRRLVVGSDNLHLVTRAQLITERYHLVVDAGTRTTVSNVGMYLIGEVEHRGSLGELPQFSLRREHKDFVLIEVHLELVHGLQPVGILQGRTDAVEPVVNIAFSLHALIAPMRGQTLLSHLVHAL